MLKNFSPRAVYIYIYALIIYIYVCNNHYIHTYIYTHNHANAHTLCLSLLVSAMPLPCLASFSLAPGLFVRSVRLSPSCGWHPSQSAHPLSPSEPRRATIFFAVCFSFASCFGWLWALHEAARKFLKCWHETFWKFLFLFFVCRKFYVNKNFYVNKYLPKAKVYIDVSIYPLVCIDLCKLMLWTLYMDT